MKIDRLLTAAAAVSLIAGAALAQPPAPAASTAPPAAPAAAPGAKLVPNGNLIITLRSSGQFNTFVKALDATNLSSLLQSSPGLTVFAPTDAAFPQSKLDAMMADKAGLQKTLLHYIINAKIDSSKIKGARGPVPSGAGDQIVLDGTGEVLKADNANIIQADVVTSNGVIHVIDQLMIAGSVPATLPEPAAETAPAAEPAAAPAAKAPAHKKK
ncbi:MAG TPA: fasciclin domain-containing protein [Phenylobacterium sp.]|nr:fasciclin domain-containing protein [Phenylobacterium sp.]